MELFEINTWNRRDAKQIAYTMGFTKVRDITRTWSQYGKPLSGFKFNSFCSEMEKRHALVPGKGLMFEITGKVYWNNRKKPFKVKKNNFTRGIERYVALYNVDNEYVGEGKSTVEALAVGKQIVKATKSAVHGVVSYRLKSENNIIFTIDYNPSVKTNKGVYLLIGEPLNEYKSV